MPAQFTCPACGLLVILTTEPPKFGAIGCTCGARIELNPTPPPPDAIRLAGASEIEAGAAAVREYVERLRRGDR